MEKINFCFLNSELQNDWNNYVINSPTSSFVHHCAWKEIVENIYGHKPYYLIASENEKIVGVLPLFLISIPLLGKTLSSGIFGSYGGICADNFDIAKSLMNEAEKLSRSLNAKYLELKNFDNYNLQNDKWDKYLDYYTLVLKLDKDPEVVWNNITKKARQNIRKAQSSNITVVTGNEYLNDFYELMANNMRLLGTPVHSKKFYEAILKIFNGDAELFIARLSDKTISVALTIKFGKYIFGYANAAHPDFLSYKPNFLIYWEIIKSVAGSNIELFDLGRSLINSGTFIFKQNFGAYPAPLYYDYYLNKIKTIPAINQENIKFKLATNIWSHLPLSVTKIVGPHLIKYVT